MNISNPRLAKVSNLAREESFNLLIFYHCAGNFTGLNPLLEPKTLLLATYDIDHAPFENLVTFVEAVEECGWI